jgi:putative redox protein
MTIRMYATHKQLPLTRVGVKLKHTRIEAGKSAAGKPRPAKIDRIEREIEIEGDLDPQQRERMLAIANRCPVHRTLHSEIVDRTFLKPTSPPVEK